MVAPLIVGVARVTAKKAVQRKTAGVTAANSKKVTNIAHSRSLRNTQRNLKAMETEEGYAPQEPANRNYRPTAKPQPRKKRGVARTLKALKRKNRAKIRGLMIMYSATFFYIPQFFFAFMFISAVGLETNWKWLSYFLPTEEILGLGWLGASLSGILMLIGAVFMFAAARVKLTDSGTLAVFAVCVAGYLAPYLFLFPWVLLWVYVVIKNQ
ncbi:MAG: hypothetical protein ACI9H6_000188 [Patiriisocius sp.]|jgi:hypothetical protein